MSDTIGIDFGTLSGRVVVVDTATGEEKGSAVVPYAHGVMDDYLAQTGEKLPADFALQDPEDYLEVLRRGIPEALARSGGKWGEIIGIGIDFTACTMLPTTAEGIPLCKTERFRSHPQAYVKLWKHHAAQPYARRLNQTAEQRKEPWLGRYGGKISGEWLFPKIWETLEEDPEVYDGAAVFAEAADWIVWQLTGRLTRNACTAGYKAIWHKREGYPSPDFFAALHPRLRNVVAEKLEGEILSPGQRAGTLTAAWAAALGLSEHTAVAAANVDAHVTMAAAKLHEAGALLAIMGTSTCHILLGEEERMVPGMCGVAEDGILPGFFGYEAGQSCVGDHFSWLLENLVPPAYFEAAAARGVDIYALLEEKAAALAPGQSGLLALDWWNGNRSVLVDADVTGCILGMTLSTKSEEIYRTLIEATAFGTRMIVENFRAHGVPVDSFYASGGISWKSPLAMQIYADVLHMPIHIAGSRQGPALGSAIFAAVAAGAEGGGYETVAQGEAAMGNLSRLVYEPIEAHQAVYEALYGEYAALHDYFGRGANPVMKVLKKWKKDAEGGRSCWKL